MTKLAFLFLIYDEINQEELWNKFFKGIDPKLYSIYIHYKNEKPLKYFQDRKLDFCLPTKYGDISIIYAQKLLLKEALKDPENSKFIFASQSCIPLRSFEEVYEFLATDDSSYFDTSSLMASFPRCNSLLQYFKKEQIYKASQWCILNRFHSKIVLEDIKYIDYFNNIFAPDEHYFITICKLLCPETIAKKTTTFVNWDDTEDPDGCSPKEYKNITFKEYQELKNSQYLFARKFTKNCIITKPLSEL